MLIGVMDAGGVPLLAFGKGGRGKAGGGEGREVFEMDLRRLVVVLLGRSDGLSRGSRDDL